MSPWGVASVPYSLEVMIVAQAMENREKARRTVGNQRRMKGHFLKFIKSNNTVYYKCNSGVSIRQMDEHKPVLN